MALGEHFGERKNGTFSFHETTFMFKRKGANQFK